MKFSKTIKKIMFKAGLMNVIRHFFNHHGVAILRYHSIVEPNKNYYAKETICLAPNDFENQVKILSDQFNIIGLDEAVECISRKQEIPDKAIAITFDDGYRDNFLAYQILNHYNVTGTFYITADCIEGEQFLWLSEVIYIIKKIKENRISLNLNDETFTLPVQSNEEKNNAINHIISLIKSNNLKTRENIRKQLRNKLRDKNDFLEKLSKVMLTWDQVREMSRNGMCIGSHTMSHLNLPNADKKDAIYEIRECKHVIERKIGRQINHFSYPNGGNYDYFNPKIKEFVIQAGYRSATTSNNGVATLESDLYALQRIRITNDTPEIIYQISCEPLLNN